jgi:DNA-binding PadR family transcriptional regulator
MRNKRFRHSNEYGEMKFRQGGGGGFGPEGRPGGFDPEDGPGRFGPGGGGRGPFGPGFGHGPAFGRGGGPGPRMRGRRRRGDVRLALLMLLKLDGPRNGYQLMQGLDERSDGRWRPSPGSVYPALAQLEDEGLIRGTQVEGESGRTFELTDTGVKHLDEHHGEAKPPWEPEDAEAENPRIAIRNGVISIGRAAWHVAQDGTPVQIEEAVKILEDARRKLYRLLAGDDQTPTDNQPSAPQS